MKKKIFIVSELFYPSKNGGGPVISLINLTEYLKKDYDLYLLTYSSDYNSEEKYENIIENEWNNINGVNIFYVNKKVNKGNLIGRLVNEIKPDYIYINSFFSRLSIRTLFSIKINKKDTKIVLSPRGELSPSALAIKSRKKKLYTKLFKLLLLNCVDTWYSTSTHETNDINKLFKHEKIIMIPNFTKEITNEKYCDKKQGEIDLVFISRISNMKNLKFALETLMEFPNTEAKINYDIYGPIEDIKYWGECKTIIEKLPQNITVEYKGFVDHENINTVLSSYDILFLPTKGENFGHIIYESMANGCIPLISDRTPWLNLSEQKLGWDLPLKKELFINKLVDISNMDSDDLVLYIDSLRKFIKEYNDDNNKYELIYEVFS